MRLNVLSDLHLSLAPLPPPGTDADVVVLAGDVARPAQAVAWCRAIGKPVLYVPGNHEFYGGSLPGVLRELRQLAQGTPVHVLDNAELRLGGVRFLGSTLWSDFLLFGDGPARDAAVNAALAFMHDFQRIFLDDEQQIRFTPLDAAALFQRNAAWLAHRLAEPFDGPTVVITHHAPSARCVEPRFERSPLSACFASHADHLLDGSRVALWIHGHMHHSIDCTIGGTRLLCNPRGYARNGVNENPAFDPALTVEIA